MNRLLRKRWFWGLLVLVIVAGAVAYWLWPRRYDITVSRETTYLLGPLHPDGTVNYVAAIDEMYSEGVTLENNAVHLLMQAAGPVCFVNHVGREGVLDRLGIKPLSKTGDYFVGLAEYLSQQGGEKPSTYAERKQHDEQAEKKLDQVMTAPWSPEEHPTVAEWLEANEKPLSLVVSATSRARYYLPVISTDDPPTVVGIMFPGLTVYEHMSKALSSRAMLKVGSGQTKAAFSDLLAAHRLARLVGQGPTLLDRLVALNSERAACQGSAALAASGKLTATQARAFLANLQALSPLQSPVDAIDQYDRFVGLDMTATYARQSWKRRPFRFDWEELFAGEMNADWDEVLRKINHWYDMEVAAMCKKTFPERRAALADFEKAWEQHSDSISIKRYKFLRSREEAGKIIVSICVPSGLGKASVLYDKAVMHLRLVQVALALAACKAEKGKYPEKLADLKPAYLKKIPNDLFIEKPLHYKRTGEGYLLYSVGPNMKDNGGKEKGDRKDCDDISVRAK